MTDPIPAVPPTFLLRMRLQTARGATDPFVRRSARIDWGTRRHIAETNDDGDLCQRVDGRLEEGVPVDATYDTGTLYLGNTGDDGFVAKIAVPLRRNDLPEPSATPDDAAAHELSWRLANLGWCTDDLFDALTRFLFAHDMTHHGEDRHRFGDWTTAGEVLCDAELRDRLLTHVAALHDGSDA